MIFEKQSTRTRLSFEAGIHQLGGEAIFLNTRDSQLSGRGEPVRGRGRGGLPHVRHHHDPHLRADHRGALRQALARAGDQRPDQRVPPLPGARDLYTYIEHRGDIRGRTVAWIGDSNNMCHSWLQAAELFDFKFNLSTPPGYEIEKNKLNKNTQAFADPMAAAKGADLVTTDVWTSMGFEASPTSGSATSRTGRSMPT